MTPIYFSLPLVILISGLVLIVKGEGCIVTIQNGTIHGALTSTGNPLKNVCSYLGIPFAAPPTGHLKFMPPQPPQTFGSLNATTHPNGCPQFSTPPDGAVVSEDCLFLNVYHPVMDDKENVSLPVMILFHGGGYTSGETLRYFTPTRLLAQDDVILVVVHYRLGMIGFFSTGDEVAPGNWGLKDQSASIRWVHENVNAFGGNVRQVTVFGESAGGSSALYQMISPLNQGMIHRVMAQSMPDLNAIDKNPAASAKFISDRLGCPTTSSSIMISCLRQQSWERIL